MHRLRRARRQAATHPHEAPVAVGKLLAQRIGVDIGEDGSQLFDGLVAIDDARRVGEQRVRFDVGRQQAPVAIDDVGTREAVRHRFVERN